MEIGGHKIIDECENCGCLLDEKAEPTWWNCERKPNNRYTCNECHWKERVEWNKKNPTHLSLAEDYLQIDTEEHGQGKEIHFVIKFPGGNIRIIRNKTVHLSFNSNSIESIYDLSKKIKLK